MILLKRSACNPPYFPHDHPVALRLQTENGDSDKVPTFPQLYFESLFRQYEGVLENLGFRQ